MDEKICETPITGHYVAQHMKDALGSHAILKSFEAKKIAIGEGFVSTILQLKLEWEPSKEKDLPATIIVKAPIVESLNKLMAALGGENAKDEAAKAMAMMGQIVTMVHKAECDFYNLLGKTPPIKVPKFYVALPVTDDAPGMIIMEDLSEKSAIGPSLIDGMTLDQILAAVTEVARLHAWSLTTKTDWRSKTPKLEDREQLMRGFLAPVAAGYKDTKTKYPEEFGSIDVEKLIKLSTYDSFYELMNEHKEIMDDVIVHGDFHMMNIMFEKNQDGSVSDRLTALLDFQAVLSGNPGYDVARLYNFSVCHKLRRQHNKTIQRRYYDEVKSIAGDKFKATFDQLCRLSDRLFAVGSILMIASIPMTNMIMVRSEGDQKEKDEKIVLERMKANYDDAVVILGLR